MVRPSFLATAVLLFSCGVLFAHGANLDTSFIRMSAMPPSFQSESQHLSFLEEFRAQHPARQQQPQADEETQALDFSHALRDRAMLMFRSLDANHDKLITHDDVMKSPEQLAHHLPGVTPDVFAVFIEAADKDGDRALTPNELMHGLSAGLEQSSSSELIQMGESLGERGRRRVGFLGDMAKKVVGGVKNFLGIGGDKGQQQQQGGASQSSAKITPTDEGCVMCQYIVERAETNVRQSGVIPSMSASPSPEGIYLELESKTGAELSAEAKDPFDMAGATIIGTTRQSTRYQRLLERQKYNEIYRVVDITLDDVCEQGMPNDYYPMCKSLYQVQADVVDGLRYQYRPADICFRVGMCQQGSYITQGIHSRYRGGPGGAQQK